MQGRQGINRTQFTVPPAAQARRTARRVRAAEARSESREASGRKQVRVVRDPARAQNPAPTRIPARVSFLAFSALLAPELLSSGFSQESPRRFQRKDLSPLRQPDLLPAKRNVLGQS